MLNSEDMLLMTSQMENFRGFWHYSYTNQPFISMNVPIIMLEIIKINIYQSISSNNSCHPTPAINEVMNVKMFSKW